MFKPVSFLPTLRLSTSRRSAFRAVRSAVVLLAIVAGGTVHALEFSVESIPLSADQIVTFMPIPGSGDQSPMLVIIETPDMTERERQTQGLHADPTRTVSLYRRSERGWQVVLRETLDESMDIVDTVSGPGGMRFAAYRQPEVVALSPAERRFETLLSARTMFIGATWEPLPGIEMFMDLNEDGLDDFLLPGFDGWQVSLQTADGFNPPQTLGPGPQMEFGDTADLVGYRALPPYLLDGNADGRMDLAFWINGRFEVYQQQPDRGYAEVPQILDPGMNDVLGSFMGVEFSEGDDENPPQRMIEAVGDIDGDGLTDLVIQTVEGDGIFGLETSLQIHRGYLNGSGGLAFETEASSVVASNGIQIENERRDLTGDGSQEFLVTSVDVTLGAIIGALLTRSATLDVDIYQMSDGVFADKPSLKKKIKARLDFGGGDFFVPAVLSADVDGDGRKDLLVQKNEEALLVYPGEAGERLFQKRAIQLDLSLPKDREGFLVSDLDGDGRDELILLLEDEETVSLAVVAFETAG